MSANTGLIESNIRRPCGAACRVCAGDGPPEQLSALPQWVVWRWEQRNGKWTKPPINPGTGGRASTTDPATWGTYAEAREYASASGAAGIGFVFTEHDRFAGVDIDDCRDPPTGDIQPWARALIEYIDSYTEVSPSGTGVKIFVTSAVGAGIHRGDIEVYDRGRYFTLTCEHLSGTPSAIEDREAEITTLRVWLAGRQSHRASVAPEPSLTNQDGDEGIIARALNASNGAAFERLWRGDRTGYPSQSEADLALACHLAFWTSGDAETMDRLFRASGLYRLKWDERHYGNGRTYGQATVEKALQTVHTKSRSDHAPPRNGGREVDFAGDNDPLETDLGNATRMARQHGLDVRYCFVTNRFHIWDGNRWAPDETGEIYRLAKRTARSVFEEAKDAPSTDRSKHLAQHAVKSQAEARLTAMVGLMRSEPNIPIVPSQLDSEPWLFNVLNCTINLRTGERQPHVRGDLISKIAPVRFDREARCPEWLAFLDRIMAGNEGVICFLQKAIGYSLTGDVSEQVVFFLHGTGANGKSTLLSLLLDLIGDYGRQAAPALLTLKRGESHPTELADLAGARFVAAVEVDEGRRLAEALTKWLTGGDRLKARFMREDFFEFSPTHKIWLVANHKPTVIGSDHAIWRRLRLIPFEVVIPDAEQDRLLGNKLRQELPGILNWALEGCLAWQREGLVPPQEVVIATKNYREEQDILAAFIRDCCLEGAALKATAKELYAAFRKWFEENGETPLSQKVFGTRLSERGFTSHRGTGGQRWWAGIGLVTHPGLDSDTSDG